ncbi:lipopolysaccharide biosynthesis protein [Nocardioides hungaricus]
MSIIAGTAGAQLISAVCAPVLTRVYTPEQLGTFTIVTASAAVAVPIATLRWELAIPVPINRSEALTIARLGLLSCLATWVVLTLGLAAVVQSLPQSSDIGQAGNWLLLAPFLASLQGTHLVLNQLAIRRRMYSAVGRRNFMRSGVQALVQVGAGLVNASTGTLVLGAVVGNIAASVALLRPSQILTRAPGAREPMRRIAIRFRRFPLILGPSAVLNALGLQAPFLLIAATFGPIVAGWLGLTLLVLAMPVALLGQAIAQVYLGELGQAHRDNDGSELRLFLTATRWLALFGLLTATALVIVAPSAFSWVFGDAWETSGHYTRLLAIPMAVQLIVAPVSQTLAIKGRQGLQLAWDASRLVLTVGCVGASILIGGSAVEAVRVLAIASTVAYVTLWGLVLYTLIVARRPARRGEMTQ